MFQYVLRYPLVVREAAEVNGRGCGGATRVEANVKKVRIKGQPPNKGHPFPIAVVRF